MGQAKQRGTFEERQAEAIKREAERMAQRQKEREERQEAEGRALAARRAPSPTERRRGGMSRMMLATAAMAAVSMGAMSSRNLGNQGQDSANNSAEGEKNG
jgi:ferric-dicitrate binding protein FerR (iron transport regulator)